MSEAAFVIATPDATTMQRERNVWAKHRVRRNKDHAMLEQISLWLNRGDSEGFVNERVYPH